MITIESLVIALIISFCLLSGVMSGLFLIVFDKIKALEKAVQNLNIKGICFDVFKCFK